tara:strand:+ start:5505 stop:6347 length:843 start_codon:yes stop_codon:yes gene_type:complete
MLTHNQEQLIYWINEREIIRKKKEAGLPSPWSDNPVMQTVYFCNVNREDDKVTKWILENWKYDKSPYLFTFSIIVARIFNLPSTLERLHQPIQQVDDWLDYAEDVLDNMSLDGDTIWNGAYIVSTNGQKIDKATYCINLFKEVAEWHLDVVDNCKTLAEAHTALMGVRGLASFMAGQVVADLKCSEGHPLQQASDWNSFSAPGPGSLRGLTWFFEESVTAKNYHCKMQEAYDILDMELHGDILDILSMQNLQNCMCEFDKFMRVSQGTGRSKRKYKGQGK